MFFLGIGDVISLSNNHSADTDDSDSTEYRNLFLGLTDELDDGTYGFSLREEPSDRTDKQSQPTEQGELSEDAAFEEFLLRTPPYMTDEPQVEEAEIHHYPIRTTRSDISSYYETPLRNHFWTRRRSSSRSRHVS